MQRVGLDADARYVALGLPALADGTTIPTEVAERAVASGRLTVATLRDEVVGWVYVTRLDGELCLGQISVAREAGGNGVGTALLLRVIEQAKSAGEPSIVLNTQRDVAWCMPWYLRHGFVEIARAQWSPALAALAEAQAHDGLDWTTRVHMRRAL